MTAAPRSNKLWIVIPVVGLIAGLVALGIGFAVRQSMMAKVDAFTVSYGPKQTFDDCTNGIQPAVELVSFVNWQTAQYGDTACIFTNGEEYQSRMNWWIAETPEGQTFETQYNAASHQLDTDLPPMQLTMQIAQIAGAVLIVVSLLIGGWGFLKNRRSA